MTMTQINYIRLAIAITLETFRKNALWDYAGRNNNARHLREWYVITGDNKIYVVFDN